MPNMQEFLPEFTKLLRSMLERNPAQRIAIVGIVEKLNLITKQLGGDAQINTPRGSMGGNRRNQRRGRNAAAGEASGGTDSRRVSNSKGSLGNAAAGEASGGTELIRRISNSAKGKAAKGDKKVEATPSYKKKRSSKLEEKSPKRSAKSSNRKSS